MFFILLSVVRYLIFRVFSYTNFNSKDHKRICPCNFVFGMYFTIGMFNSADSKTIFILRRPPLVGQKQRQHKWSLSVPETSWVPHDVSSKEIHVIIPQISTPLPQEVAAEIYLGDNEWTMESSSAGPVWPDSFSAKQRKTCPTYNNDNKCGYHIEAETKWPTFRRRHFQTYFLQWKCLNFDENVTEVCS